MTIQHFVLNPRSREERGLDHTFQLHSERELLGVDLDLLGEIGNVYCGGIYIGDVEYPNGIIYSIFTTPKSLETTSVWSETLSNNPEAQDWYDGLANTEYLAANGFPAAQYCMDLVIEGGEGEGSTAGWYLPAKHEADLFISARSVLEWTALSYYWTSTEYAHHAALAFRFEGNTGAMTKTNEYRVRPVRRMAKSQIVPAEKGHTYAVSKDAEIKNESGVLYTVPITRSKGTLIEVGIKPVQNYCSSLPFVQVVGLLDTMGGTHSLDPYRFIAPHDSSLIWSMGQWTGSIYFYIGGPVSSSGELMYLPNQFTDVYSSYAGTLTFVVAGGGMHPTNDGFPRVNPYSQLVRVVGSRWEPTSEEEWGNSGRWPDLDFFTDESRILAHIAGSRRFFPS